MKNTLLLTSRLKLGRPDNRYSFQYEEKGQKSQGPEGRENKEANWARSEVNLAWRKECFWFFIRREWGRELQREREASGERNKKRQKSCAGRQRGRVASSEAQEPEQEKVKEAGKIYGRAGRRRTQNDFEDAGSQRNETPTIRGTPGRWEKGGEGKEVEEKRNRKIFGP